MEAPSKSFITALLLIGVLCVGLYILGQGSSADNPSHTRAGRERVNLTEIASAVRNFQIELNSEPPVPPGQFFASLRGSNSKGIAVLGPAKVPDSEAGRCDVWRTPYQVFLGGDGWLIRSAGPNRVFDDLGDKRSDDMTVFVPSLAKNRAEQAVAPNRSLPPSQNSTPSDQGPEE